MSSSEYKGFGVCPATVPCHCEGSTHIKCNSKRLKQLPFFLDFLYIWKELDLSDNLLNHLELGGFNGVQTLSINLGKNTLTVVNIGTFQGTQGVELLDLSYNYLSFLPAQVFQELTDLLKLLLSNNR